jgi:prepilin-type N-terminal cleavage/methylation domain-containing protein
VRTRPFSHGFTLLEVLVALVIVSVAFVGLLGHHVRNLAQVGYDQDLTRAALLAREFITRMEVEEEFPDTGFWSTEVEGYPGFVIEREVSDTDLPDVRRVVLRVVFDERRPDAFQLLYFIHDEREPTP